MKLLTADAKKKLLERSEGHKSYHSSEDSIILEEFFDMFGRGIWLITHAEELSNGDSLLYGLVHIFNTEWGVVLLSELESLGFMIERKHCLPDGITILQRREQLGI